MYKKYPARNNRGGRKSRPRPLRIKPGADRKLKKVFDSIGIPRKKPFVPDPFQLKAVAAIEEADCLVTAPTGAGKTWIAQQAIARILDKEQFFRKIDCIEDGSFKFIEVTLKKITDRHLLLMKLIHLNFRFQQDDKSR